MASYELWLTDADGKQLQSLDNFLYLQAARIVNRIGAFELRMPPTFDERILEPDRMIQVWRAPIGGRLDLWRVYLLRKWRLSRTQTGEEEIALEGPDVNDLLRRRIVAHYAGSSNAAFTSEYADDMMKTLVTDAITDGSNPSPSAGTRVWSLLSVAQDRSAGPQINKAVAWKPLLTPSGSGALGEIAAASVEAGTEVFFDIVPDAVSPAAMNFIFRTWTGQPGQDVSDRVVFSAEAETLEQPYVEYDYLLEANYIYAGGTGVEDERAILQVYDDARYGATPLNRCEAFADARNEDTDDAVTDKGREILNAGRPIVRAGGRLMEAEGTRLGINWNLGDRVRARYRSVEWDAIVRAVVLTVDGGLETIDARLDYES